MGNSAREIVWEDKQLLSNLEKLARGESLYEEFCYRPGNDEYDSASRLIVRAWNENSFPPIFRTLPLEKRTALMRLYRTVCVEKKLSPSDAEEATSLFSNIVRK